MKHGLGVIRDLYACVCSATHKSYCSNSDPTTGVANLKAERSFIALVLQHLNLYSNIFAPSRCNVEMLQYALGYPIVFL